MTIFPNNEFYMYSIENKVCYFKINIDSLEVTNNKFLSILSSIVLNNTIENQVNKIIVDLDNVMYLDSTSMGLFISVSKIAKSLNKEFIFVNLRIEVIRFLSLLSLDTYFNVVDNIKFIPPWLEDVSKK
jgi:anti-anti-sigma factor